MGDGGTHHADCCQFFCLSHLVFKTFNLADIFKGNNGHILLLGVLAFKVFFIRGVELCQGVTESESLVILAFKKTGISSGKAGRINGKALFMGNFGKFIIIANIAAINEIGFEKCVA